MRYGLSMKWHNSCNRQTVVALYFLRAPKIHTLKNQAFFVRYATDEKGPFCMSKNLKQTEADIHCKSEKKGGNI